MEAPTPLLVASAASLRGGIVVRTTGVVVGVPITVSPGRAGSSNTFTNSSVALDVAATGREIPLDLFDGRNTVIARSSHHFHFTPPVPGVAARLDVRALFGVFGGSRSPGAMSTRTVVVVVVVGRHDANAVEERAMLDLG